MNIVDEKVHWKRFLMHFRRSCVYWQSVCGNALLHSMW